MKNWKNIVFALVAIIGLFINIYIGFKSDFSNGYYNIIGFLLFSVLAISKITKKPL